MHSKIADVVTNVLLFAETANGVDTGIAVAVAHAVLSDVVGRLVVVVVGASARRAQRRLFFNSDADGGFLVGDAAGAAGGEHAQGRHGGEEGRRMS
jgi:hypothetical protein